MSKITRILGLSLSLVMVLALVGGVSAQDKILHTALGMVAGDVGTIDTAVAEVADEIQIINTLFVGVTAFDEFTGATTPGMASSWDVSDDGLTTTFHLIEGVPWVHYNADTGEVEQVLDEDGNPRIVTAHDFEYGWKRSFSPELASPYSYIIVPHVVGAEAYNAGEGSVDDVQVAALDDFTLQVTAPEAVGFRTNIYGLWMGNAQPQWVIDEYGDEWTEPENINTYGPFALSEWAHDESLSVVRNPFWPGTNEFPQAKLDGIVFHFLDSVAQMAEYEAGTLHAVDPPQADLDRIRADPALSEQYSVSNRDCTYYYGFDQNFPETGDVTYNVHLRRALSYAIDRQAIVDNVTKGGQQPARWMARPGLVAAPTVDTHPDAGIGFDPEAAQAELALALEELGVASAADLPTITLGFGDVTSHAQIAQAVQQMWTDTLGITVQLTPMDTTTYFDVVSEDPPPIYRSGWCSDYVDANNFLRDTFGEDSSQNDIGFLNDEFNALLDQAYTMTDVEARRDIYAQAENILVRDEAVLMPIYWYTYNQLTRDCVTRNYPAIGSQRYEKWDMDC